VTVRYAACSGRLWWCLCLDPSNNHCEKSWRCKRGRWLHTPEAEGLHCWVAVRSGPPQQRATPAARAGIAVLRQGAPCTSCRPLRRRTSLREGARLTRRAVQAAAEAAAERAHAAAAESPGAGAAAAAAAARAREAAARAQRSAAAAQARPDGGPGPQLAVQLTEVMFAICVRRLGCISAGACGSVSREGSAAPGSPPAAVHVRGSHPMPLSGLAACSRAHGARGTPLQGACLSRRWPCRSMRQDAWPDAEGDGMARGGRRPAPRCCATRAARRRCARGAPAARPRATAGPRPPPAPRPKLMAAPPPPRSPCTMRARCSCGCCTAVRRAPTTTDDCLSC